MRSREYAPVATVDLDETALEDPGFALEQHLGWGQPRLLAHATVTQAPGAQRRVQDFYHFVKTVFFGAAFLDS